MSNETNSSKIDVSQLTSMSLKEALSTIWPFKGIKKPIGICLEEGDITVRDLAWAAENAYDEHLKHAAQTALISRLMPEKLAAPIKPARILSGAKYTS